ncbi:conserved hypothetical protein [Neospora caninum Liverpool]|uniref:C2 tensin-type domain-containing protein n=1 Tax=Neospora caninum (strain Liverpool) TaxID=572307 RepID=F0VIB0_NEOCL|nr:conserved hypothetical protein [Neospora caninum Liverpool]CBZ53471.1 conserved hypothetical protein [Neospora caninum Liverpool]|eukprot:XP_003883503.1 conserved hypothetical protein [Neospora caninum Liverpool]
MNFLSAVRSLTSSAHQSLLHVAGHPSGDSEPPPDWPFSSKQHSLHDDAPPQLVPYSLGQERQRRRGSPEKDGASKAFAASAASRQNAAGATPASREAFPGTRAARGSEGPEGESLPRKPVPAPHGSLREGGDGTEASTACFSQRTGSVCSSPATSVDSASASTPSSSLLFDAGRSSGIFGSAVANIAAAAAHSLLESIEQSSQQLFRPPGMYKVSRNIWIIDYPDPGAPNTGFLVAYLERHHANKYLILNMSERQYQHVSCPASKPARPSASPEERDALEPPAAPLFPSGAVLDVAYRGLPYPPLSLTLSLLLSVHRWIESDVENVLLVHCLEGFSRSITFVAAYLHWTGAAPTLQVAVRSLEDVCGVDATHPLVLLPSQKRFLRFFQHVCVRQTIAPSLETKKLRRIILNGVPAFLEANVPGASPVHGESEREPVAGQEVALFRPVIEVWYQGKLVFSSLDAYATANDLGAKQPFAAAEAVSDLASSADERCVPADVTDRLPVYTESDGSIRFEIPGLPLSGDVLLKLLHVSVQRGCSGDAFLAEREAAGSQESRGSKEQTESKLHAVGRKICTARIAFHTSMTREGGCLEFRKAGMDGAVVLPAFPDDCFMSVFFEELGPEERESPEETERQREEMRLIVEAQKEGAAVRAGRSQKPEGKRTEGTERRPCEEEQRRIQKRLELRQQVQEYKALAEQWRRAASGRRSSPDERRAATPPRTEVQDASIPPGPGVRDESLRAGDARDFQVFEARLTDGESNGEDDREPGAGLDFFHDSLNAAAPRGRSADEQPSGVGMAMSQLFFSHLSGANLPDVASRSVSARARGETVPAMHPYAQLEGAELGTGDDLESESDVSWGNDDEQASDVGREPAPRPGEGQAAVETPLESARAAPAVPTPSEARPRDGGTEETGISTHRGVFQSSEDNILRDQPGGDSIAAPCRPGVAGEEREDAQGQEGPRSSLHSSKLPDASLVPGMKGEKGAADGPSVAVNARPAQEACATVSTGNGSFFNLPALSSPNGSGAVAGEGHELKGHLSAFLDKNTALTGLVSTASSTCIYEATEGGFIFDEGQRGYDFSSTKYTLSAPAVMTGNAPTSMATGNKLKNFVTLSGEVGLGTAL